MKCGQFLSSIQQLCFTEPSSGWNRASSPHLAGLLLALQATITSLHAQNLSREPLPPPPIIARDDAFTVFAGVPVVLPVSALLANDIGAGGSEIHWVRHADTTAQGQTVVLSPDGSTLSLVAATDSVTEDSLTYTISDGHEETTATVRLNLLSVPLAYEGFEYPAEQHLAVPPSGTEPPKSGGFGWSGPWVTEKSFNVFPIDRSSLRPPIPGFEGSGGAAVGAGSARRPLLPLILSEGRSLWFSAVLRTGATAVSDVILEFQFESYTLSFVTGNNTGTPPFRWGMTGYYSSYGPVITPDQPAVLVAEVKRVASANYDLRLYVNPPLGAVPPITPDAAHSLTGILAYRQLNGVTMTDGGGAEIYRAGFDEIRIGTSFQSVTPGTLRLPTLPGELLAIPGPSHSGTLSFVFHASDTGDFALERQSLACGGVDGSWQEVSRAAVLGNTLVVFLDSGLSCGAIYRVKRLP